ncbi:CPBP family intramembrane glutamic endopeptidase [Terriglobus sp.]|uniref:CPBP family intramembrane glutamic endopeptidase n=1 Tax=Terriglobus sp. TaxID=1889013 RepID=UPI003B00E1A8
MPDAIEPQAQPIPSTGPPEWAPTVDDDSLAASQPPRPHKARAIFFGTDGLRAGWSFLLFYGMLIGCQIVCTLLMKLVHLNRFAPAKPGAPAQPMTVLLYSHGLGFVCSILLAAVMARIEHRHLRQYGLGSFLPRAGQFLAGCLWGGGLMSLLIAALFFTHRLAFDGRLLHGGAIVQWGAIWAVTFLAVGLFEEYLTRGYLYFTLSRGFAGIAGSAGMTERRRRILGFWATAFFFSALFGLSHYFNVGETSVGLWSAGLIGLMFAFSLWRTGSLWWAVGWHTAWDWMQSFVYGVRDSGRPIIHPLYATHPLGNTLFSGGPTGPEGSLYVFAILLIAVVGVALTLRSEPGSPSDPAFSPNMDHLRR